MFFNYDVGEKLDAEKDANGNETRKEKPKK